MLFSGLKMVYMCAYVCDIVRYSVFFENLGNNSIYSISR